jgi:hypothetical protein
MQRADLRGRSRQRDVDIGERARFFRRAQRSPVSVIDAVTAFRTSFSNLPTTGRSSFESVFICSPQTAMLPLRPR